MLVILIQEGRCRYGGKKEECMELRIGYKIILGRCHLYTGYEYICAENYNQTMLYDAIQNEAGLSNYIWDFYGNGWLVCCAWEDDRKWI